jgi:DNA-binding response OmpR family regulator
MESIPILVVDDDEHICRIITNVLSKQPAYEVETASDGRAALERLREESFRFDLVITDMAMPQMTGEELIRAVVEESPQTAFVVLTAHANDEMVIRCLSLGVVEFLVKPFQMKEFLKTVDAVLQRTSRRPVREPLAVESGVRGWVELTAPTDFEYVNRFQKFTALLSHVPLGEEDREDIRIAVAELGQNAVEWGNQNDRQKRIHLSYCLFDDRLVIKIEDEGPGFDPQTLRDPSIDPLAHIIQRAEEGKRPGGYGVFLSRRVMDDITYSETGNVVLMSKYLRGRKGPPPPATDAAGSGDTEGSDAPGESDAAN